MWRILIVENNREISDLVVGRFDSAEFEFRRTQSLGEALELTPSVRPGVVLCEGVFEAEARNRLRDIYPKLPILVMDTGGGPPRVNGLHAWAFDYLFPPLDPEDLVYRTEVALRAERDATLEVYPGLPLPPGAGGEAVVGGGSAMQAVIGCLARLAHSDSCVLISGEDGTGKSLVARCLHHQGKRRSGLIVTVDCSQRHGSLELELFGDPKRYPISRFEQAAGGTLFLRHVDRLPLAIQSRLADWLAGRWGAHPAERQEAEPRILAATSCRLEEQVAQRLFREDLFNLLSVKRIDLPPLRERREDIVNLAAYFLGRTASESDQKPKALSEVVSHLLAHYEWPQNVRELENTLHRACSFARGEIIQMGDLPADLLNATGPALLKSSPRSKGVGRNGKPADIGELSRALFELARRDTHFRIIPAMERELVIHAMAETAGNQVQAARLLGITRATLRKRLLRFKIHREVLIH
jgi:two-component system nitrogen regulation response regulator GlnG